MGLRRLGGGEAGPVETGAQGGGGELWGDGCAKTLHISFETLDYFHHRAMFENL